MNCPNCNKEMKLMCRINEVRLYNGTKRMEILGRCDDCDFDATWIRETNSEGETTEYNFERYIFG